MPSSAPLTAIANGAILAARFVERDPGGVSRQRIKQGTANCRTVGIGPEYAVSDGESTPYAVSGFAKLTLGGSVTAGDRLKSDSTGRGVGLAVGGTVPQNVGAFALQDGAASDVADVQIENYTEQPGDYLS